MLKFTPGEVMKMGSLEPLVEMFGVEREEVPGGLRCLSEQGLVVKEGHFNWCLTELGCEKMREASA
ncbi:hypothetical protein [Luteolibacter soli]|uniref:hypothetical protein n=1 Tax=Luteolibacter soli TaxID=3135280 RepID=UPI0031196336